MNESDLNRLKYFRSTFCGQCTNGPTNGQTSTNETISIDDLRGVFTDINENLENIFKPSTEGVDNPGIDGSERLTDGNNIETTMSQYDPSMDKVNSSKTDPNNKTFFDDRNMGPDPNCKCDSRNYKTDPRYTGQYPPTLQEMFPQSSMTPGPSFLGTPNNQPDPDTQPPLTDPPLDTPDTGTPNPPNVPSSGCPNFHPNNTIPDRPSQAQVVQDITNYVNYKGFKHDPDGISWLPRSAWTPWDGVTTINPCTSTKEQIKTFIFPPHRQGGSNTMRGLRELFYQVKPFKDNSNPTVSEIENWNIEVIRHFRRLLGFNQTTHPVSNHKCTFLEAAWTEERARSNHWSATYPPEPGKPTLNGAYGPCTLPNGPNAHCGSSFMPNAQDQTPYLCGMPACTSNGGAEGVLNVNTDLPWAIKMSRIIGTFLDSDGITAHTGPFIGREFFGSAWWMNGGQTVFRGKWNGRLAPTCP